MRGGISAFIKSLQCILQSTRSSATGRVLALSLGRLERTASLTLDVITVDLIAAKNPILAVSGLQTEQEYSEAIRTYWQNETGADEFCVRD